MSVVSNWKRGSRILYSPELRRPNGALYSVKPGESRPEVYVDPIQKRMDEILKENARIIANIERLLERLVERVVGKSGAPPFARTGDF